LWKKVAQNGRLKVYVLFKTDQIKKSPNRQKFAQSGHPGSNHGLLSLEHGAKGFLPGLPDGVGIFIPKSPIAVYFGGPLIK
jgi:hypothetical protein